jgi:hypothetical protein
MLTAQLLLLLLLTLEATALDAALGVTTAGEALDVTLDIELEDAGHSQPMPSCTVTVKANGTQVQATAVTGSWQLPGPFVPPLVAPPLLAEDAPADEAPADEAVEDPSMNENRSLTLGDDAPKGVVTMVLKLPATWAGVVAVI